MDGPDWTADASADGAGEPAVLLVTGAGCGGTDGPDTAGGRVTGVGAAGFSAAGAGEPAVLLVTGAGCGGTDGPDTAGG